MNNGYDLNFMQKFAKHHGKGIPPEDNSLRSDQIRRIQPGPLLYLVDDLKKFNIEALGGLWALFGVPSMCRFDLSFGRGMKT